MSTIGSELGKETLSDAEVADPLAGFKRRTYSVIFAVTLAGCAFAWSANELAGSISGFTRFIFPLVLVALTAALWAMRAGKIPVRFVEEGVYAGIGSVLIAVLVYALYFEPQRALTDISLFSLHLWFPFIYIFVFLAHERRGALIRAVCLYALSVSISVPVFFLPAVGRTPLEEVSTLGLAFISGGSIIAVLYFLTSMKDDLRRTELNAERLKRLAETDPLTGVLNRRGLETILDREIGRARRTGEPLSLTIFDLDDFKLLNDTYGHDSGDEALVGVVRKIKPHLRDGDSFARWGGEEFAILAPDTSLDSAYALADRLRMIVEGYETAVGSRISASFGVSSYRDNDSGTTLSKRADVALYRAKEFGKNRTETVI